MLSVIMAWIVLSLKLFFRPEVDGDVNMPQTWTF